MIRMLDNCKCKPARRKLRFVGRNESMGLRKGGIYEAFIYSGVRYYWVAWDKTKRCPYDTLDALRENWEDV